MKRFDIKPQQGPGYVTVDGQVIFQRHGTANFFELSTPEAFVSIQHHLRRGEYAIEITPAGRQATALPTIWATFVGQAFNVAVAGLNDHARTSYRLVDLIGAYCWGMHAQHPGDVFISPTRYEPGSDTIRHIRSNVCLIDFGEGGTDRTARSAFRFGDPSCAAFYPMIDEAIRTGLHECDYRQGEEYCKRRLAWLVGALIATKSPDAVTCEALPQTMESSKL